MPDSPAPVLIRPVYDPNLNLTGFHLATAGGAPVPVSLLSRLAEEWAGFCLLPEFRFFIPLDPDWLHSGLPGLTFPAEQVVFVLSPEQVQDSDWVARHAPLGAKGYGFALAGEAGAITSLDMLAGIALLDAQGAHDNLPESAWKEAEQAGVRLFACDIGSMTLFEWCKERHFAFNTFACLDCFRDRKDKPRGASKTVLMRLLALVVQDADTHELEQVLRNEPKLAYDLLRLVNSASMGMRIRISSFGQAITILGRRQLLRWMQLLLFAHRQGNGDTPCLLMQRAAARGRLMELLVGASSLELQEQAFMVGVFSCLDILMGEGMDKILKPLLLDESIEAALLRREGFLGGLLKLVEDEEMRDFGGVAGGLGKLKIDAETFCLAQAEALNWAYLLGVVSGE